MYIFQHATEDTRYVFAGVENIIRETFLPRILFGKYKYLPHIVGTLSNMKLRKYVLGLQAPVTKYNEKHLSLLRTIRKLIEYITGETSFSTANNVLDLREEIRYRQKIRDDINEAKLKLLVKELEALERRLIICTKNTGS